jgi:uncharacterized protein YbjT (DUF2867 family)
MRVAVAGGTGTVGRLVVGALRARGDDAVVLARSEGVDVVSGAGLGAALAGADVVVDVLNAPSTSAEPARLFFATAASAIQLAAVEAGARRIVCLSILGIERASGYGYYAAKLAQEKAYREGPVPVCVVRSTQWHEFVDQIIGLTRRGPVATIPRMRVQPVAAASVAEVLVDVATADIVSDVLEVAGPQVEEMTDLARRRLRQRGTRSTVLPVPFPGAGRAVRDGALLPGADARLVGPAYDAWAAEHP